MEYSCTPSVPHSITPALFLMFRTIQCAEIDFENTEFLMSYPAETEAIQASVGTVGVVQPIVVDGCPCSGGYRIVSGFRRAYACRRLGIASVNAYMYQVPQENPATGFWLALQENASHRTFNMVEKALILDKLLTQFQRDRSEVLRQYMPLLGLNSSGKVLDGYLRIAGFSESIKAFLADHDVPLNIIELLAHFAPDDREAIAALAAELRLGVNKIKELILNLDEIALRDGQAPAEILARSAIREALRDDAHPAPQKAEAVRRSVHALRYPQFTEVERRYHDTLQHLQLPKGVQFRTDRFFEDDRMSVGFQFRSADELRRIAAQLSTVSEQPELADLLRLVQGE